MTGSDPWGVADLDLDGYLRRVGVAPRPPSRAAVDELLEAHVRAFTFDNVDVLLGRHAGVGLAAVQEKFVGRGRGGYCFEHATLFAAVLERLGYDVRRRLGRVGPVGLTARTHMTVLVRLDGEELWADPGFGMSLLRPVPLVDGAEDEHRGWRYRVVRVPDLPGWQLMRLREEGWELMHTMDELPVHPVDVVAGHHFTSTHPDSHFTRRLMITKHLPGRHLTVTSDAVTVRRPGRPTEHRPLADGELDLLVEELEVRLSAEELDLVHERLARDEASAR